MGCQSEVELGSNLTFSLCTHDPDTGILTDADADAVAYRIYEDDTESVVLSGSMVKFDDANTTGFYTKKIACTTANGFEKNKSYSIYITATVGGDQGGIAFNFRVTDIVNDVHDEVVESTLTFRQMFRMIFAVLTGASTGGGTTTVTFRDKINSKARVSTTVDGSGNRAQPTLDGDE